MYHQVLEDDQGGGDQPLLSPWLVHEARAVSSLLTSLKSRPTEQRLVSRLDCVNRFVLQRDCGPVTLTTAVAGVPDCWNRHDTTQRALE